MTVVQKADHRVKLIDPTFKFGNKEKYIIDQVDNLD